MNIKGLQRRPSESLPDVWENPFGLSVASRAT